MPSWRWHDPSIAHFTQPDSVVPDSSNPLSLNRWPTGLGGPDDGWVIYISDKAHTVAGGLQRRLEEKPSDCSLERT